MKYTFVDISSSKLQINGFEMYKVFVPFKINDNYVSVLNVYDSKYILMPRTHVSDIMVNNSTYNNANDLITALTPVVYSFEGQGSVDQQQIEENRQNIFKLQQSIADISQAFNDYYTTKEIDQLISSIDTGGNFIASGVLDGDKLIYKDSKENPLFSVNVHRLLTQGSRLTFLEDGSLILKNIFGEELSSVKVKAKENIYEEYLYTDTAEPLLRGFIPTTEFTIAKTADGNFYFVHQKKEETNEYLQGSRIFLYDVDEYFDLTKPDIDNNKFNAWELKKIESTLIPGNKYGFNVWFREGDIKAVKHTSQSHIWTSGTQKFFLQGCKELIAVYVNGQLLAPFQFNTDIQNEKIEILDTLEANDNITIIYLK